VRTAASSLALTKDGPALSAHHTGELMVDAALGAHIAKMCELAWLVFQFDTEEVDHDSPPQEYPTIRNLRPLPVRRKPALPTAPIVATTSS
jgi:hypothetical protein